MDKPLTPGEARMYSSLMPGRWMTTRQIGRYLGYATVSPAKTAAKHANALTRRGLFEKRKDTDATRFRRPTLNPTSY